MSFALGPPPTAASVYVPAVRPGMLVVVRPPARTRSLYVRPPARSASACARPSREVSVSSTRTNGGTVTVDGSTRPGRVKMNVAGTRIRSDGVAPVPVAAPAGGAVPWTFVGLVGVPVWGAAPVAGGAPVETGFTMPESSPPHPARASPATAARATQLVRNVMFVRRRADKEHIDGPPRVRHRSMDASPDSRARKPIEYDAVRRRLWLYGQRCHHGATGAVLAGVALTGLAIARFRPRGLGALAATGGLLMVHDWKDRSSWFEPGRQVQP